MTVSCTIKQKILSTSAPFLSFHLQLIFRKVVSILSISLHSPPVDSWTHSNQDSVSTTAKISSIPLVSSPLLYPIVSVLGPHFIDLWAAFDNYHLVFLARLCLRDFQNTTHAWFPGCLTNHLRHWWPQSLLLVPSHLPTSEHRSPQDLFLARLSRPYILYVGDFMFISLDQTLTWTPESHIQLPT